MESFHTDNIVLNCSATAGGHMSQVSSSNTDKLPDVLMAAFSQNARVITLRRGQFIAVTGTAADEVYLVLSGRVQATVISPNGRETILREVAAGQLIGDFAVLGGANRSTNIVARDAARLAGIPGAQFHKIVTGNDVVAAWMMANLVGQLRTMSQRLYEMSTLGVGLRVCAELLRLCQARGLTAGAVEIDAAPTHSEIAALIGANRESVTRELNDLSAQGLIAQAGRKLRITSVERLAAIVERQSAGGIA